MSPVAEFRDDLTGLRAVAVVLVVLFHAGVPGFGAGFVGVDVFFVLSGFLICRSLARQIETEGRIDLVEFWAARARRLLPAATLVICSTLVASMLIDTPFVWRERLTDAWASSLYWANVHFGSATQSYFGASSKESPFLHFWSLSIEEQTYLALPLLMSLSVTGANRGGRSPVRRLLWGLFLGSLALSVLTTQLESSPMTYFFTPTRIWEIAAGGVLAMHFPAVSRGVAAVSPTVVRALGFGLLAVSLVVVDSGSVFPGAIALVPVTATVLIIAAIGGRVGPLEHTVAQWLGERSYSWYLWHWPVIVLGTASLDRWTAVDSSWSTLTVLAGLSLLPAAASYRWVERPLRFHPVLRSAPRRTATAVGSMVLASLALLVVLGIATSSRLAQPDLLALDDARTDYPALPAACSTTEASSLLAECIDGPTSGSTDRILLLGDSHMANWAPAFISAGNGQGRQVVSALGGSCPIIGDGVVFDRPWCVAMRSGVWSAIDELAPTTVVLSHSTGYYQALEDDAGEPVAPELGLEKWTSDLVDFVEDLRERGIDVVVVQPTPSNPEHPILCASLGRSQEECVGSRDELGASVADVATAQGDALASIEGVSIFDPITVVCPSDSCLFEENGRYVWNDDHHITTAFAATKADVVAPYLSR